ncbi:LOW QUALITY PROTEIN: replication protein A 30 kDa subunit [Glossophaga mutica]
MSGVSGNNDILFQGVIAPVLRAPRSRARIENIVPCCVNQLLTTTLVKSVFKVRGIVVTQFSIIGIIRKVKVPNCILYKIDDTTTKPIDAHHWLSRGKAKQELTPYQVEVYAKVFGILGGSAEVKILEVLPIPTLEDMNEFTHIMKMVSMTLGQSALVAPSKVDQPSEHGEASPEFIQKEVLHLILCPQQEGKSIRELQTKLCSLSINAVKEALEYLMVQGHMYPSVDGEHFKSAE